MTRFSLDEFYANRPDTRPSRIWPVYGFEKYFEPVVIALFFNWNDAVDFVNHPEDFGCDPRHLYMTDSKPDNRKKGYRPCATN